jgi:2-polyprenyl-3-methyl-5-hydroxy-6-metoxy-1,4-benzoquinol methylase
LSDERYWAARVERFGHTGWSDAAVYAYDQQLRLAGLLLLLQDLPLPQGLAALDFGCGVGDFCAVLARRCERVVGHDLSRDVLARAAALNTAPNLRFSASLDAALSTPMSPYGLIVSITVLQHVVDDAEVAVLLQRLARALQPGGHFIVLESFAAAGTSSAPYLKRRTVAELVAASAQVGLVLRQQRGFYHPSVSPTAAFTAYRQSPAVRLLSRLAGWRVPGAAALLGRLARAAATGDHKFMDHANSPTQWLVFERRP